MNESLQQRTLNAKANHYKQEKTSLPIITWMVPYKLIKEVTPRAVNITKGGMIEILLCLELSYQCFKHLVQRV